MSGSLRLARYDEVSPTKLQRRGFRSGEESLDRWLATQARQSMESRDAVTYLLMDERVEPAVIAGYFCTSAGQVSRGSAPPGMTTRAPDPVPVIRMGRLAVNETHQGQGLGADLLREALLSAVSASRLTGARLLLVDALNESARRFYERWGFEPSPTHPMQLLYDLRIVEASAGH